MEWMKKLSAMDMDLFRMIESFTGHECQIRNGGKYCYFLRVDYSNIKDPDVISALMDAIEGRVGGRRFVSLCDHTDKRQFVCYIRYVEPGRDEHFSLTAAIIRENGKG